MKDITERVARFRECARTIWNGYLREFLQSSRAFDVLDQFNEIERRLFYLLVLQEAPPALSNATGPFPIPCLRLQPASSGGAPILVERPSSDGNRYWDDPLCHIGATDLDLRLVGFFDWDEYGFRDYRFYLARIVGSAQHPQVVGRDALLDVSYYHLILEYPDDDQRSSHRALHV